ncbi:methylmalonyl-CoA epimerase [bacterium]|nr:methylmalonyl-CoA epimerase [bacterium]
MLKFVDHIGIAVEDLDAAIESYKGCGLTNVGPIEEVKEQGVKVVMIQCGETCLELLQATGPDSPVGKFIEKRGYGMHHVAYRVDDVAAAMDALKSQGRRALSEAPRHGHAGSLVCFMHPKDMGGVLTELVERPAGSPQEPPYAH